MKEREQSQKLVLKEESEKCCDWPGDVKLRAISVGQEYSRIVAVPLIRHCYSLIKERRDPPGLSGRLREYLPISRHVGWYDRKEGSRSDEAASRWQNFTQNCRQASLLHCRQIPLTLSNYITFYPGNCLTNQESSGRN
jgi:hypothetical protein